MNLLCQSVLNRLNPKMKILFSATILPPIHASSFVLIHYVKRKKLPKLLRNSDLKFLQFYKMPGRKKKTTEEPKPVQTSSNSPEKENNPDNPGRPVKCSCPMKKHPNNSRTCNKKNPKSKQNSKKKDSDSDSDFEPESKMPKMSPLPKKTKVTKKPAKKPTKKSSPIPSQAPTAILDENYNSTNILTALKSLQHGTSKCRQSFGLESCARSVIVNKLKEFCIYKSVTPFDRRVTALAWHPKNPKFCAVGSKGGEIVLWKYENNDFEGVAEGIGPGGSIQKIQFDPENQTKVYTCSIDGTFEVKDLGRAGTKKKETFLNTGDWNKWYTTFDVAADGMTLLTGENSGNVTLLTTKGEMIWRDKLHKGKVTNIEFSPREPWLFATTSIDNSVKIWDIRNLTDAEDDTKPRKDRYLQSLEHDKPVNAAYFSHVDGTRLLTTDQHSQIRVYRGPFWDLERILPHPHRQFQHLTPIKATWHPLVDLVVAGRYPDEKFPGYVSGELRTIDVMNPDSGAMECQISQDGVTKISSLNLMSPDGNALLSGMGTTINIWKQKPVDEEEMKYEEKRTNVKDVVVEEWPGFKPKGKKGGKNTKKSKKVD